MRRRNGEKKEKKEGTMGRGGGVAYTCLHVLQGEVITNKSRRRAKPGHGTYTQALRAWQVQSTLTQLQENVHNHSEHALGQFQALTFLLSRGVLPETAGGGKRSNQNLTNTPTNRIAKSATMSVCATDPV